jgi:cystathionine beta-lyase/cystathionine gamma-synthase
MRTVAGRQRSPCCGWRTRRPGQWSLQTAGSANGRSRSILEAHAAFATLFDRTCRCDSHNFVYGTMWALYSPRGSTFAFEVTGGEEAFALLDNFQIMKLAVSLGGAKTLISHPASITLSGVARELREEIGLTDALIRISVGIGNVEDSISEIAQGLEHV